MPRLSATALNLASSRAKMGRVSLAVPPGSGFYPESHRRRPRPTSRHAGSLGYDFRVGLVGSTYGAATRWYLAQISNILRLSRC
jgi:hypothetical protein